MKTKLCSCCKVRRSLTEFCKCKRAPDGLQYACKRCWAARARRKYWAVKALDYVI